MYEVYSFYRRHIALADNTLFQSVFTIVIFAAVTAVVKKLKIRGRNDQPGNAPPTTGHNVTGSWKLTRLLLNILATIMWVAGSILAWFKCSDICAVATPKNEQWMYAGMCCDCSITNGNQLFDCLWFIPSGPGNPAEARLHLYEAIQGLNITLWYVDAFIKGFLTCGPAIRGRGLIHRHRAVRLEKG